MPSSNSGRRLEGSVAGRWRIQVFRVPSASNGRALRVCKRTPRRWKSRRWRGRLSRSSRCPSTVRLDRRAVARAERDREATRRQGAA